MCDQKPEMVGSRKMAQAVLAERTRLAASVSDNVEIKVASHQVLN